MDMVRALVTGPVNTPYSLGCFAFDVYFPSQYPNIPPLVKFLTTGNGTVRSVHSPLVTVVQRVVMCEFLSPRAQCNRDGVHVCVWGGGRHWFRGGGGLFIFQFICCFGQCY